jgi:hypothetical protein
MVQGLHLSNVAPTVETSLERVGELVKLMKSGGAGLTDTQSQRLVGYMGSLDDMRGQLGIMSQHYEDDEHILSTLTLLMDRIDESLGLVNKSTAGSPQQSHSTRSITFILLLTLHVLRVHP